MEVLREGFSNLIYFLIPITLIYIYCHYKLNYWRRRGVTQLSNSSKIFGDFKNGILFRTAPGSHLGEIYKKTPSDAPFVGFYIFHKPCLLLKDPEIIKQIMVRDFDSFPNRHFAGKKQKDSIGMVNLFGVKNPAWKYLRGKISATLNRTKLKQMLPLMMETGEPMMEYLNNSINDDNKTLTIDAQEINNKYTADLLANIALGTKTNSFQYPDSDYAQNLKNFFHSFRRMVALVLVYFIPELVDVVGSPILFDSSFIKKMFWTAVEAREESGEKRGDFIDSIMELKNGNQDPRFKLKGDNLMYQSGTLFSGFESSSTVATFTLMELARHPECQERAREDIKQAIDKHGWTLEAFNDMKYLDRCVAEGVRLHPPVTTIDRYAECDYKIPHTDIIIEKGTPIYISLYGIHGDPKFFDEPELYNPERFNGGRLKKDAYIPFGIGPRACIGVRVGQLHVKVILSMILSGYKIYQEPGVVNKLDSRATFTAAADGIMVEVIKLNK